MMGAFFDTVFWNNTLRSWLFAIAIFLVSLVVIKLFRYVISRYLKKWTEGTDAKWDDLVISVLEKSMPLAYLGGFYLALYSLHFGNPKVDRFIQVLMMLVCTVLVLRIITTVARHSLFSIIKRREDRESKQKQARGLIVTINLVIWILGFVFLIDNLGYDVTTLVAGLGIGGIAIALAAQAILGDLFSYFVIFFDRPFEPGDFITVEDKMGTVENVGIKTTRIRTLGGEQLVFSNTDLTNSRLHNFKRMTNRRVVFKLSVEHHTPHKKLQEITAMVNGIISSKEKVRLDRGHFSAFGESTFDFEFVYFVDSPDYNLFMDIQQSIYLEIVQAFEDGNISFANPTRTVWVKQIEKEGLPGPEPGANGPKL